MHAQTYIPIHVHTNAQTLAHTHILMTCASSALLKNIPTILQLKELERVPYWLGIDAFCQNKVNLMLKYWIRGKYLKLLYLLQNLTF